DDRVWLGRADLAVRTGKWEEARRWLERCLASRPDDPVVWSTALELALAADDVDLAGTAAGHLTTADLPPDRVVHARAWFAAPGSPASSARASTRVPTYLLCHSPSSSARCPRSRLTARARIRPRPSPSERRPSPPGSPSSSRTAGLRRASFPRP